MICRRSGFSRRQAGAIAAVGLFFALAARAEEPLIYRRLLVPVEALDSQIRGLLPLKRDELERRLAVASHNRTHVLEAEVRLDEAVFEGRLEGAELTGDARLRVVHASTQPALLPLSPCSLLVHSLSWIRPERQAAVFGTDEDGKLLCLVDDSADLSLQWRQAASSTLSGHLIFELQLPASPRRTLQLNLPADVELQVDSGLLSVGPSGRNQPDRRSWTVALSSRPTLRLEIFPAQAKATAAFVGVVRDAAIYNVLPAAVDFETTLNIDILKGSAAELILRAEPAAEILAVRVNDQPARFHTQLAVENSSKSYAVELPAPLTGIHHTLTVSGTSTTAESGTWHLPRVLPAGVSVEEGSAEVTAPAWLHLHPHPNEGYVQTVANTGLAGRNLDRFEFQLFSATASIQVAPSRSIPPIHEDSGTQTRFDTNQVTGVFIADLSTRGRVLFQIDAQIAKRWMVDAVETQPPEALADRTTISEAGGSQRLKLQFTRPISNAHPLRLTIRAHARRPAIDEQLDESFFRFARFPDARAGRQWLSIAVSDSHVRFEQRHQALAAAAVSEQLTADDLSRFEEPVAQVFNLTAHPLELRGQLVAAKGQYDANILVRAEADRHSVTQRASIHCRPESSSIASVLVELAPPPAEPVTWRLAGQSASELPATLESMPIAESSRGAFFRVLLPRAQSAPFELVGEWSSALVSQTPLTLVTAAEATHQQGLLAVFSHNNRLTVKTSELRPLPIAVTDPNPGPALRAQYQYDTSRRSTVSLHLPPSGSAAPNAWIETAQLVSRFSVDGHGQHEASFVVHTGGDDLLQVQPPASGLHYRLVGENGEEEPLEIASDGRLRIPLDAALAKSTLRVRYRSQSAPAGIWPVTVLHAPFLHADVVTLERRWTVLIPPEFIPANGSRGARLGLAHAATATSSAAVLRWQTIADVICGPRLLWRYASEPQYEESQEPGFAGWHVAQVDVDPGPAAQLWLYQKSVVTAWSWCLMLVTAAVTLWLRPSNKLVTTFVAGWLAVAFFVTAPWSSWGESIAIGTALGGVLLWSRCRAAFVKTALQPNLARSTASAAAGGVTASAIALALLTATAAVAQSTKEPRPRLIIPVDANQQPSGDYVYVDNALYAALYGDTQRGGQNTPQWLLERAHYEIDGRPNLSGDQAAVDEIRIVFDFYTFHDASEVRFALHRQQIALLEGRARLDGQAIKPAWRADGDELSLRVADAGRHRLELAAGATARRSEDGFHLDLAVPPAAHATVRLPPTARLLMVNDSRSAAGPERIIRVSQGHSLHVFWPQAASDATPAAGLEAEQLSLWRVRAGAVVLETLLHLKPSGKPVREVVMECDPRLRVLPMSAGKPVGRLSVQEGSPTIIKIEFPEPIIADTSLRLTWVWPDASGVGQWEFPTAKVRADRVLRDWNAVWVEPGLALDATIPEEGPSAANFAAAFGESDARHILATWEASQTGPRIECKPQLGPPRAQESLELSLSKTVAAVRFTAQLSHVLRHRFEHRLSVPANVRVKQVAVSQRGRAAPAHWERTSTGEVAVFLLESPEPEQTLELVGEIPLTQERLVLQPPRISVQDAERNSLELRVYRQPEVGAAIAKSDRWQPLAERLDRFEPSKGRLIATLRGDEAAKAPPPVTIGPNQPRVGGQMLVGIEQVDGDWFWQADLDLQISGGLVDALVLSAPDLSEEIEVTPEMDHHFESGRGQQGRLILRPPAAATGTLQVRLRGPLDSGAEGLAAPDISLVGLADVRRYVLLARGAGGNQFDWETIGLTALDEARRQTLPTAWRSRVGDWFQVSGSRYQATAHTTQAQRGPGRIPLADLRGVVRGRRLEITADLTVLPTGENEFQFSLPPGCRLLQTQIDGFSMTAVQNGLRTWKIAPINDALPYRVSVMYDTFLPYTDATTFSFPAPELGPALVEQTLLSLDGGDQKFSAASPSPMRGNATDLKQLSACGEAEADLIRVRALGQATTQLAAANDGTIPPIILAEVFARFDSDLVARHEVLERAAHADDASKSLLEQAIPTLDAVRKARQRLEHAGLEIKPISANKPTPIGRAGTAGPSAVYLMQGDLRDVNFPVLRAPAVAGSPRFWLAAVFVIGTAVLMIVPIGWPKQHWLASHSHRQIALLALMWWLIAPLGWLGLVVLMLDVVSLLRPSSATPRAAERGSSLLRVSASR